MKHNNNGGNKMRNETSLNFRVSQALSELIRAEALRRDVTVGALLRTIIGKHYKKGTP